MNFKAHNWGKNKFFHVWLRNRFCQQQTSRVPWSPCPSMKEHFRSLWHAGLAYRDSPTQLFSIAHTRRSGPAEDPMPRGSGWPGRRGPGSFAILLSYCFNFYKSVGLSWCVYACVSLSVHAQYYCAFGGGGHQHSHSSLELVHEIRGALSPPPILLPERQDHRRALRNLALWGQGIWTQVFMLELQALYPLSHCSSPYNFASVSCIAQRLSPLGLAYLTYILPLFPSSPISEL